MPQGLTRDEQRAVREVVKKAQRNDGVPRTAQQSIPFDRMFPDGICRVGLDYYTKTIQFQDINYQLAQNEEKNAIFENWCDFLNYFDSSIRFQLSFINQHINMYDYQQIVDIPPCGDDFDAIREEYTTMLQDQLAKGNNGLQKVKFISFSIEAANYQEAKPRLERIETDILANFKVLGVRAETLLGSDRLKLMHDIFHSDTREPFLFDYDEMKKAIFAVADYLGYGVYDCNDTYQEFE